MATAEQAHNALDQVKDSGSGRSAIEMGWIDQVRVIPPRAVIRLTLPGFAQSQRDRLAQEARQTPNVNNPLVVPSRRRSQKQWIPANLQRTLKARLKKI